MNRVLALVGLITFSIPTALTAAPSDEALAWRWAPVHYQDVDATDASADYISRIDFDDDWITANNWDHQATYRQGLHGAAYYSVVTTATHWFIVYAFYHPRDWTEPVLGIPVSFLMHENDMEGLLLVVRRSGAAEGTLEGMVTVAHRDFYSYLAEGSPLANGAEDSDGRIYLQNDGGVMRPTTRQEAKGHGLYAWNQRRFPGGDGITYYPRRGAVGVPRSGNDREAGYELVPIFATDGLWARRFDPGVFASWGTFHGEKYTKNSANAPWGWDDHNDRMGRGMLATDPAGLVADYFSGLGDFVQTYEQNLYQE